MKFHFFTLIKGSDLGNMAVDRSEMNFPNELEAHKFALRAAALVVKEGVSVEISARRKLSGPEVFNVKRAA